MSDAVPDTPKTSEANPAAEKTSSAKTWAWRCVKWGLCLLVLGFVGQKAYELWQKADWREIPFQSGWLILAGVFYGLGWLPSVWFWRRMISQVGGDVRFDDAARAYYCGHLGKYVPGKATVLVIRSALLKDRGAVVTVSVLTATCETLMMMATGLAVAVALSPWLAGPEVIATWPAFAQTILAQRWLPGLLVVVICLVLVRIIAGLLTLLAVKFTPKGMMGGDREVRVTPALVLQGLAAFAGSWMLHGLSLAMTLKSVGGELHVSDWLFWTGGVAAATSAGFLAIFAPGGLGVREGILIAVLQAQPHVTDAQTLAVPVLLRLVWLLSEVIIATALYYGVRGRTLSDSAGQPDD